MRSFPWYTDPMENNNAGTTFVLKRVQRENPLLLVILHNIRFSFHFAMLEKSGRSARALAKTRVDKPSWVKRSKEIGVFVLARKGGRFVGVACPHGFPWWNQHGKGCYASYTYSRFSPNQVKALDWRKETTRAGNSCLANLLARDMILR